jgi:hypothetical protein
MKYQKPLKDWKHWIGHGIVTLVVLFVIFIVVSLNVPQPYSFLLLFISVLPTIAIVDAMNHRLNLQ